jgi:ATP-dependent DNA ligase
LIESCLPTPSSIPRSGPEWLHEIKHDGFRMLVRRSGNRVRILPAEASTGHIAICG